MGLTVLAVGFLPMPSIAKQDPKPSQDPSAQVQLPPGQAKKQAAAQQPAPAPAPARQPAPAPAPIKHQAKHGGTVTTLTSRQAATATTTTAQPSKQQAKAAQKTASQGNGASAQAQAQTSSSLPPGQAKKVAAAAQTVAPTPAAAPAPQVTNSGTFTAAKTRHKARKHRTATRGTTASSGPATPIATIAPAALAKSNPSKTKAAKGPGNGYVPAPPTTATPTHDDSPNVVFRTVRDAVEVIPSTIWILLGLLTGLASLFAVTSARQTRRAHRLAAERGTLLGDVGVLQEAVLPVVPPRVGALALSVAHRPAGGPAAGGDFYDVIALDHGRTALVVGDVTGHGPGPLGQATLVRFTLRAHLESGAGPREALAIATESLAPHFDEGFATAAVAIHDPNEGTLTYATAAHEAPIVVGPGGHDPILVSSTPPLGIGAGGPSARRQTTVPFPEKSLACMLTDGVLEARVRGELVGRARVEEWVSELGARPAAGDMAEMIRSRAAVSDDLAVCFATSTAGEDTGSWRVEELHRPTPDEAVRFLEACGAGDEQKRTAAEALRFTREGMILTVRIEDDAVVSAEVLRTNSPKTVAA